MLLAAVCFIVLLLGPGYLLWLNTHKKSRTRNGSFPRDLPFVDVIVPLKDESLLVEKKLRNLRSIEYPSDRIQFWLIDGASSDGTVALIKDFLVADNRFHLLELPVSDKTAQLNHALPYCKGSWSLVTDADAILPNNILTSMISLCESPELAVIGAQVEPHAAISLEHWHWKFSNWLRIRESDLGYASFVTAPCYLFRRDLLQQFPQNTISDDIHVALLAMSSGKTVLLIPSVVTELRSPVTFHELILHKWRKSRAYFREIFRFLPKLFTMPRESRKFFLWRSAQMI